MRYLSLLLIFSCTIASAQSPRQIPILTYHQVRDWKAKDSKSDKDYIIPPANFAAHIKMLADSGYHPILPDELISGGPLPSKPIMLTFDDTNEDQFKVARPILIKYHFKAVYFIITGKIGTHKWFMNAQQIKQLSDEVNMIGCHPTSPALLAIGTAQACPICTNLASKPLSNPTRRRPHRSNDDHPAHSCRRRLECCNPLPQN